ncbi:DUF4314 domain-containing protein [Oscillospiraceae bacterium 21-37]
MAEHYKAEYPSGTRIMLLSMGEDIHRIGDNTRGTVISDWTYLAVRLHRQHRPHLGVAE